MYPLCIVGRGAVDYRGLYKDRVLYEAVLLFTSSCSWSSCRIILLWKFKKVRLTISGMEKARLQQLQQQRCVSNLATAVEPTSLVASEEQSWNIIVFKCVQRCCL